MKVYRHVAALALLTALAPHAGGSTVNFDGLSAGTINGQAGWTVADQWGNQTDFDSSSPGVQRPDEAVVNLGGNQVWRMSNAYTRSTYADQPFSHRSPFVAGETGSSLWNNLGPNHTSPYSPPQFGANANSNNFRTSFDFRSVTGAPQAGLSITLSPSAKRSSVRMSYLRIFDGGSGLNVDFIDSSNGATTFTTTNVASNLSYSDWHSVAMDVTFVDGVNFGSGGEINGNDVVQVFVNGALAHTGTTWESYYYAAERIVPTLPRLQAVDSMLIRSAGTAAPGNLGNGLYFDNFEVVPEPATTAAVLLLCTRVLRRQRRHVAPAAREDRTTQVKSKGT